MRVSAAQFFAMSEADRAKVTHIDMDLDREAERWTHLSGQRSLAYKHPDPDCEPGTDWVEDKPL